MGRVVRELEKMTSQNMYEQRFIRLYEKQKATERLELFSTLGKKYKNIFQF